MSRIHTDLERRNPFMHSAAKCIRSLLMLVALFLLPIRSSFAGPPNVVMILGDDQAWGDYGFMGHAQIRTPHLDRLASQGILFRHGYVPSSLCRPSLACSITGLYPRQHKITSNDPPLQKDQAEFLRLRQKMIDNIDDVATIPKLLTPQGYVSFQCGKWWEGNYRRGGFTQGMTHGDPARGGRHGDVGLTIGRKTMQPIYDFIESSGDQPFFIWYAPFLPHQPHNPPQRLLDHYRNKTDSIQIAKYWAMCEWFDETCGELLKYLDDHNLADNTIVLFFSDNGWIQEPNANHYAPRSKRSPYDGGLRTPIIVRWPGHVQPTVVDTPVSSIDLAPTILRAVGIDPPSNMPGVNLLDAQAIANRPAVFGAVYTHNAVDIDNPASSLQFRWGIHDQWKLILPDKTNEPDASPELFHLADDPNETRNLIAEQSAKASELHALIDQWWNPAVAQRAP